MSAISDHQLMDRIISRLEADPIQDAKVTTRQLTVVTTQLIDTARQLNAAFAEVGSLAKKQPRSHWRMVMKK